MSRRTIDGKRAIVTGASSGIGRELARELCRRGADLVITARREDRLRELVDELRARGRKAEYVAGDIAQPEVRQAVLEAAEAQLGGLDILVNNAGVGAAGPLAQASPERLRRIMEVNFFAPVELTRIAVPLLRSGNRPIIVNISSVLGHRAVPNKSEYCASKFALHGISDSLRAELASDGIDVLLVSPSTTESEFFDSVLERTAEPKWFGMRRMPAEAVARKAVRAIMRGRHEIILTPFGRAVVWIDRICPPLADRLVARFG